MEFEDEYEDKFEEYSPDANTNFKNETTSKSNNYKLPDDDLWPNEAIDERPVNNADVL